MVLTRWRKPHALRGPARLRAVALANAWSLLLSLVIAVGGAVVLAPPAQAAACDNSTQKYDFLHRPSTDQSTVRPFYGDSSNTTKNASMYVGWALSGSAFTSVSDLWIRVGTFTAASGAAKVKLATNQSQDIPVRTAAQDPTAAAASAKVAYAYLSATSFSNTAGQNPTDVQNFVVTVYNGQPTQGGSILCTFTDGFKYVYDGTKANANKVSSITASVSAPALGTGFQIVVKGSTGTIGAGVGEDKLSSNGVISLSPATNDSWDADAYTLTGVSFKLGATTSYDRLRYWPTVTSNQAYTATYAITARATTGAVTPSPISYIASGGLVKFSDISAISSVTLPPVTVQASINKTVTSISAVDTATYATYSTYTVNYRLELVNQANTTLTVDNISDSITVSSGGIIRLGSTETATVTNPSATWIGAVTGSNTAKSVVYAGPISVAANATRVITYSVAFSYPSSGYASMPITNTVVANIADQTITSSQGVNAVTIDVKATQTLRLNYSSSGTLTADLTPDSYTVNGGASQSGTCTTVGLASGYVECTYAKGLVVTVTSSPGAGKTTDVWTVTGSGVTSTCPTTASTCVVSLGGNAVVSATYANALSLTVNGVANALVKDNYPTSPFDCTSVAGSCAKTVASGAVETVTVTANPGYQLTGLSGPAGFTCTVAAVATSVTGNSGTCTGTISASVVLTATLSAVYTLDVTFNTSQATSYTVSGVSGFGSLACTSATSPCVQTGYYLSGTVETLTVSSLTNFKGWGGACSSRTSANNTCTLTITSSIAATVSYDASQILVNGAVSQAANSDYQGTISGTNSTIASCYDSSQPECSGTVASNSNETFTATANTHYALTNWTITNATAGTGCSSNSGSCVVTIDTRTATVKANFSGIAYTITYDSNTATSGTTPTTGTYTYGGSAYAIASAGNLAKTGYTFNGWKTAGGTSYAVGESYTAGASITLYAQWSGNTYTVTYNATANGGTAVSPGSANYIVGTSAPLTLPTPATRTGYTLSGWYTDTSTGTLAGAAGAGYTPSGSITLYARWTGDTYTVTYNATANGGAAVSPGSANYVVGTSSPLTLPTPAARTGYDFSGWYTDTTTGTLAGGAGAGYTPTQSITLYAQWTIQSYTVSFDGKGGSPATPSVNANYNASLTPKDYAASRTGYTFQGWDTDTAATTAVYDTSTPKTLTVTSHKTLYAVWSANPHTITFDGKGGTPGTSSLSTTYDASVTPKDYGASRTGYTFRGWDTDTAGSTVIYDTTTATSFTVKGNSTLYAVWSANPHTITFDKNGGGTGDSSTATSYDATFDVSDYSATRTGYGFQGWSDTSTGSVVYSSGGTKSFTVNGNKTLYAVWSANPHTITFDGKGGTPGTSSLATTYDATVTPKNYSATRTGYTFRGWDTDTAGSTVIYDTTTVTSFTVKGNSTLYAVWSANPHTITFDGKGGTPGTSSLSTTYDASVTPKDYGASRTGYTFRGWDTDTAGSTVIYDTTTATSFTVKGNSTLYAVWRANKYTFTYDANDSTTAVFSDSSTTTTLSIDFDSDAVAQAPSVTNGSKTLLGWNLDRNDSHGLGAGQAKVPANNAGILYAIWSSATVHSVKFDAGAGSFAGGVETQTASVVDQSNAMDSVPSNPARTGHIFRGWQLNSSTYHVPNGGGHSNDSYTVTGPVTFNAVWDPETYTVTYDGKGNSSGSMDDDTATYGVATALKQNAFGKNGYHFLGWDTDAGGSTVVYSETATVSHTSSRTLYAVWSANPHTITFDKNGGDDGDTTTATTYDAVITPKNYGATRTGYAFQGWAETSTGTVVYAPSGSDTLVVKGDKTLFAVWSANPHTITFHGNSGAVETETVATTYDSVITPKNYGATRTGYSFRGWDTDTAGTTVIYDTTTVTSFTVKGNKDLYAVWSANPHTITFDKNGGDDGDTTTATTYDSVITPKNFNATRNGYAFQGWADTSTGSVVFAPSGSDTFTVNGNRTLFAKWSANPHTITFDKNGGDEGDTTTATEFDATFNPNTKTATRAHYQFQGWADTSTGTVVYAKGGNTTFTVNGNRTLYAKWTPDTYTVSYDPKGGSGSMDTDTVTYNQSNPLRGNAFGRTGYTFAGWDTDTSGTTVVYTDSQTVSHGQSQRLYAVWNALTYTISYDSNTATGGTTPSDGSYTTGGAAYVIAGKGTLEKTGYSFVGWNTNETGTGTSWSPTTNYSNTASITLYAQWSNGTLTVNYAFGGGTGSLPASLTLAVGDTFTVASASGISRADYTFNRWTDGTNTYAPGAVYTMGSVNVTLTATWTAVPRNNGGGRPFNPGPPPVRRLENPTTTLPALGSVNTQTGVTTTSEVPKTAIVPKAEPSKLLEKIEITPSIQEAIKEKVQLTPGVAGIKVTPVNGYTGKLIVPVITEIDNEQVEVMTEIVVNPEPPTNGLYRPETLKKTKIDWEPSTSDVINYEVYVNGKKVCTTTSTECTYSAVIGPKSKVEVVANGNDGTESIKAIPSFKLLNAIRAAKVMFPENSAVLKPSAKAVLSKLATVMRAEGFDTFYVTGHTDGQGGQKNAYALSLARAKAVQAFLKKLVPASNFKLDAEGMKNPVASNATKTGQAKNRRATLDIK